MHWQKGELSKRSYRRSQSRVPSTYRRPGPWHGNPMKLRIYDGLPRRLHATPWRFPFSEDVEPPIAARRGDGGAATHLGRIPLLPRCFALVEQALRQSWCVPRAQQSADCFMSIRGMIKALSLDKIIESRSRTLSGNGDAESLGCCPGCVGTVGVCVLAERAKQGSWRCYPLRTTSLAISSV